MLFNIQGLDILWEYLVAYFELCSNITNPVTIYAPNGLVWKVIRCHWGVRAKLAYMAIHLPANVFHLYSVMVCSLEHKEVRCYKKQQV